MGLKRMNKANVVLDALTNKGHQIVLATIYWLENCHTRAEFNLVIETALISLLDCSGVFYVDFESNENTQERVIQLTLKSPRPPSICKTSPFYVSKTPNFQHKTPGGANNISPLFIFTATCTLFPLVNHCLVSRFMGSPPITSHSSLQSN